MNPAEKINLAINILSQIFPTFNTSLVKFDVIEALEKHLKGKPIIDELNYIVCSKHQFFPLSFQKDLPTAKFKENYSHVTDLISKSAENIKSDQFIVMKWNVEFTFNRGENKIDAPLFIEKNSDKVVSAAGPQRTTTDIKFELSTAEPHDENYQKIELFPGSIYVERSWFEKKFLGLLCCYCKELNKSGNNSVDIDSINTVIADSREFYCKFKMYYTTDTDDSKLDLRAVFDSQLMSIKNSLLKK